MLPLNARIRLEDWNAGLQLMIEVLDPEISPERMREIKDTYLRGCLPKEGGRS
jgi:hypothetical protein